KTTQVFNFSKLEISVAVLKHIAFFIIGFASTKASVKGLMIPFGISFAAGIGKVFFPSVTAGVFAGYFFPAVGTNGLRYITALFAVAAIKMMIFPYKKIARNPLFLGLITLLATAITNIVTISSSLADTALYLCESILSAAGAYFVCIADTGIKRNTVGLSNEEMTSLLISASIIISGLMGVTLFGPRLGVIIGILLILISSKFGGVTAGTVSGIAISVAAVMSGEHIDIALAYAVSGLAAGVFSSLGKYVEASSVLISFIICRTLAGFDSSAYIALSENLAAAVIFFSIPKSYCSYFSKFFAPFPKTNDISAAKNGVNIRLNMAADALKEVSKTTEKVSKELSRINTPSFSDIIEKIEKDTCVGCNNRTLCWETRRKSTAYAIKDITKELRNSPGANESDLLDLKGRCYRFSKLYSSTVNRYTEYTTALDCETRIEEVRDVVCSQLYGISDMLYDLSSDFSKSEIINQGLANKIAAALRNLEIIAEETFAKTDRYGRTSVMIKIKKNPELVINKRNIMKLCSIVSDLNFDVPTVSSTNDYTYISLFEHANLKVEIGVDNISSNKDKISGDAFSFFNDGSGHTIMILSDGMGTGGRAAVDGAMASGLMSELIKAGFGYSCALKLLNSSMLFKSSDESLATLDIASIDLFSGETTLYKAGAAPSIIKQSGRCGKAESTSLPVGILNNVSFDTATIKLKDKDIVVLMSDGALNDGTEWIKSEVKSFKNGTAQDLAELICQSAGKRQQSKVRDDITVMTAIIQKAV
ncbi:MAG: SpoIIE family protein phosphatase, partial [Clostridia bacterium]|nr:SpoIIE family protein phosphatase [Clostridia bacterium]